MAVTRAASGNDETKGAARAPTSTKTAMRGSVSKRVGASLNHRSPAAATSASAQFVAKRPNTRSGGNTGSSAARCAGSAASR